MAANVDPVKFAKLVAKKTRVPLPLVAKILQKYPLDKNGYLGDLQVPMESGKPAVGSDGDTYFRHTAAYEAAGTTISFGQEIATSRRPLWPCPGMGAPQRRMNEGDPDHG